MKRALPVVVASVLAAGATTAVASTSHIFGPGGDVPQLDAQCHRVGAPVHWKAGPGVHQLRRFVLKTDSVMGNQIHCLIRRKDDVQACVLELGPVPPVAGRFDHGVGKPADWLGVDSLQQYLAGLRGCILQK